MEIVLVLLLISTVAGFAIYCLVPFYTTHRFQKEVETVYALAQELQIEALTLQSDMQLSVYRKKGRWVACSRSEEPILTSQLIDLSHVETVAEGEVTFVFYANGQVEPKEVLTFQHKQEKMELDLRRPLLIKLTRYHAAHKSSF